jgi:hypothetical protein
LPTFWSGELKPNDKLVLQWIYTSHVVVMRKKETIKTCSQLSNIVVAESWATELYDKERFMCTLLWWLIWYAFVCLVDASDNTTKRQTARCRTFVLSSCRNDNTTKRQTARSRPVSSAARQTARCSDVAWLISQSFNLNRATMWHRDNTLHDNAPFGVPH